MANTYPVLLRGVVAAAAALSVGSCTATAAQGGSAPELIIHRDVIYHSVAGQELHADLYLPQNGEDRAALLLLHSGSWQRGSKRRMDAVAHDLAARGFVVLNANYRLAPGSRFPAQLEDARAAVRWLRANAAVLRIDPARIGALGYSSGGHVALMLALTSTSQESVQDAPIQAVASAGAPTDLTRLFDLPVLHRLLGASRAERPDLYRAASPIHHVSADDPPALLLHGEYDLIVPPVHASALAERMQTLGATVELVFLPHGHGRTTTGYNAREVEAAADFFVRRLSPGAQTASARIRSQPAH